jgi:hypothetical protein
LGNQALIDVRAVAVYIHGRRLSKRRPFLATQSRKATCMEGLKRAPQVLLSITLAVMLFSALPGCGGESVDTLEVPVKKPSEIQKEAQAKNANLPPLPSTKATKPQR